MFTYQWLSASVSKSLVDKQPHFGENVHLEYFVLNFIKKHNSMDHYGFYRKSDEISFIPKIWQKYFLCENVEVLWLSLPKKILFIYMSASDKNLCEVNYFQPTNHHKAYKILRYLNLRFQCPWTKCSCTIFTNLSVLKCCWLHISFYLMLTYI
jgi:hypothetical protein